MAEVVLTDVSFDDPKIGELLAKWNGELGFPPKGGSTVATCDFASPDGAFLLASFDGIPIGFGGVRRITSTIGEVKRLFVRKESRGRGIGRALLSALEQRAIALGFEELRLDTHAAGPAALFRSAGYAPIADYNGNPYARYWFAKALGPMRPTRVSGGGDPRRLATIVRQVRHLMRALEAARAVGAREWLICAGAVRDAVWDHLHGLAPRAPRDVDLAFFDADDLSPAREQAVKHELLQRAPDLPWEASNQAAVHLWYPSRFGLSVASFGSAGEAIATFPEIATCVGIRLLPDENLLVVAPHGLDDLLGCVCRHNPTRVPAALYERRVEEKGWRNRWPQMRYMPAESAQTMSS